MWQEYSQIKADHPDSILLYQAGDFFEAMGEDAETVSAALDLTLTTRDAEVERIKICGFPNHRLDVAVNLLHDRGINVVLAPLEDGERKAYSLPADPSRERVESRPVGRLDYLSSRGAVSETIEYTDPEKFVADIQKENFSGVPMSIVLYWDKDGDTIPRDFIEHLDPPPQGLEILDYEAAKFKSPMERAKELINEFCESEYDSPADFTDLKKIGVGFTTVTDNELPIQVNVNLIDCCLDRYIGEVLLERRQYDSLPGLIQGELTALDFESLISLTDEEEERAQRADENHDDRFHVIEVGSGNKITYAIWDDQTGGYYVDGEGVQEEFTRGAHNYLG